MGNDLDDRLTTTSAVTVPGGDRAVLTLRTWYDIEDGLRLRLRARLRRRRRHLGHRRRARATPSKSSRGVLGLTGTDTEHWADTITYDLSA